MGKAVSQAPDTENDVAKRLAISQTFEALKVAHYRGYLRCTGKVNQGRMVVAEKYTCNRTT